MSLDFKWVTPMLTGKTQIADNIVYARKAKAGRKKDSGETMYQLGLTIPEEAMKKARFVVGDRVEVGFGKDENGLLVFAVRRVLSGGYAISAARGGAQSVKGTPARGKIQMTFRDGMPETFSSKEGGYEVDAEGMLVAWEDK